MNQHLANLLLYKALVRPHIERSLAEAFQSLNVIVPVEVNCVYLLIFQGYHLCVTTCSLELPKGRSYNIHVFLATCVYCEIVTKYDVKICLDVKRAL